MNSNVGNCLKTGLVLAVSMALAACGKQDIPAAATPEAVVQAADGSASAASPSVAATQPFAAYTAASNISEAGNCSLDAINGQGTDGAHLKNGAAATFGGWLGDAQGQVPGTALLVLSGKAGAYSIPVTAGGDRPDVATALNAPGMSKSGFNVQGEIVNVAPGEYETSIVYGEGNAFSCPLRHSITVE